jgi:metal-sulfur cluster biosynthetic enzyme
MVLTSKLIRETLREKMIDPELGINVVDLGLIYEIKVIRAKSQEPSRVYILMTLTTPGCPLAAVFQPMVRQALADIPGFYPYKDLILELTFDPPWHQDMMSEKAKAELGL